jgi:hypothetical protein
MTTRAPLLAGQAVKAKATKAKKKTPEQRQAERRLKRQRARLAQGPRRLEEAFEQYHMANPAVFELFCRYSFELKAAGKRRGSGPQVFERIRWEFDTNPDLKGQTFAASNDLRAYYARLAMDTYPEHFAGWFRTSMTTSQRRVHARRI